MKVLENHSKFHVNSRLKAPLKVKMKLWTIIKLLPKQHIATWQHILLYKQTL